MRLMQLGKIKCSVQAEKSEPFVVTTDATLEQQTFTDLLSFITITIFILFLALVVLWQRWWCFSIVQSPSLWNLCRMKLLTPNLASSPLVVICIFTSQSFLQRLPHQQVQTFYFEKDLLTLTYVEKRRCESVYLGVVVLRLWYFEHALLQLNNCHHILPEKINALLHLFAEPHGLYSMSQSTTKNVSFHDNVWKYAHLQSRHGCLQIAT